MVVVVVVLVEEVGARLSVSSGGRDMIRSCEAKLFRRRRYQLRRGLAVAVAVV